MTRSHPGIPPISRQPAWRPKLGARTVRSVIAAIDTCTSPSVTMAASDAVALLTVFKSRLYLCRRADSQPGRAHRLRRHDQRGHPGRRRPHHVRRRLQRHHHPYRRPELHVIAGRRSCLRSLDRSFLGLRGRLLAARRRAYPNPWATRCCWGSALSPLRGAGRGAARAVGGKVLLGQRFVALARGRSRGGPGGGRQSVVGAALSRPCERRSRGGPGGGRQGVVGAALC
jgi:hypothetical protein